MKPKLETSIWFVLWIEFVASGCERSSPPIAGSSGSADEPMTSASAVASAPEVVSSNKTPIVAPAENLLRQEKEIVVDGKKELWRLQWESSPSPTCVEAEWASCPCQSIAFGEIGDLNVVRIREGQTDERALLKDMALQRWPVYEADFERYLDGMDLDVARKRPSIPILEFDDYDHDGRATEFIIDHGSSPCFAHDTIVVGVTRKNPKPHIFSVKGHPETPLSLNGRWQWEILRDASIGQLARGIELMQSVCGNHGSGTEYTFFVRRSGDEFEVTSREYNCNGPNDSRGTLSKSAPWPESSTP